MRTQRALRNGANARHSATLRYHRRAEPRDQGPAHLLWNADSQFCFSGTTARHNVRPSALEDGLRCRVHARDIARSGGLVALPRPPASLPARWSVWPVAVSPRLLDNVVLPMPVRWSDPGDIHR
jgi:hypothetical protein